MCPGLQSGHQAVYRGFRGRSTPQIRCLYSATQRLLDRNISKEESASACWCSPKIQPKNLLQA
ncbi:hypothetical protein BDR05DRAFT_961110, partial [Suillus weaverae]